MATGLVDGAAPGAAPVAAPAPPQPAAIPDPAPTEPGHRTARAPAPLVLPDPVPPAEADAEAGWPADPAPVAMGFCRGRSGDNCVIDGDSFILYGETVRLAAIDAPEMGNPACDAEAELAAAAKARLQELLNGGSIILFRHGDRDVDRYGRSLRDAMVDGMSVSDALMAEGLARPWRGRKENWC